MEVELPSGFTADLETIPSLEATENVKLVETRNQATVMVIYFENLGRKELCPTVDAFRTHKVAMQRPAAVTVYDYYDSCKLLSKPFNFFYSFNIDILKQLVVLECSTKSRMFLCAKYARQKTAPKHVLFRHPSRDHPRPTQNHRDEAVMEKELRVAYIRKHL